MRLLLAVSLLLIALVPGAGRALAQDTALYEGEAAVPDQSEGARQAALPRALAQVLVKVTGDANADSDPALAGGLGAAAQMMQQYRYRQDVVTANGVPELKLTLIARFNARAVENLVTRAGRTVWPAPRPTPLLWLAIDDGRGARLVGEAQAAAVAALARRASQRGFALAYPKADLQDQTLGSAQAVWREDLAAVQGAARRYGSAPVLFGKMRREAGGWVADWALLDGGSALRRWSASHAEAAVVLAAGADGAATSLAQDYASRILSGPAGDYEIEITGLASAADYGRVLHYLQRLPIVRGVQVRQATPERLQLQVALRTGIEGLIRLTEGDPVLQPPGDASAPAVFVLRR